LIQELNKAIRKLEKEESRRKASEERRKERYIATGKAKRPSPKDNIPSGDDIREREVIRVLIQHGKKIMEDEGEEEEPLTVADYVLSSIEEIHDSFSNDIYQEIVDLFLAESYKSKVPEQKTFLQHSNEQIQQLAIDFLTEPYEYSANWEEKLRAPLRTQEMPEENYHMDTFLVVNHFKQKKIEELIEQNKAKLTQNFETGNEEGVNKCLAVQKQLIEIRKEVNEHLRRVVL
jgi:hypothetical protein